MSYNRKELKMTERKQDTRDPFKKDIIYDPKGQWAHPGENTRIPGDNITMQGVPYPVFGMPDIGQPMMMMPGQDYSFPGANYVDEFPMHQMPDGTMMPGAYHMQAGGPAMMQAPQMVPEQQVPQMNVEALRLAMRQVASPNSVGIDGTPDEQIFSIEQIYPEIRNAVMERYTALMQEQVESLKCGGTHKMATGGGIHINPANKGKFTAKANAAGMGVQEFASKVLSAPEGKYSPETRKQANFAKNAAGWHKQRGGESDYFQYSPFSYSGDTPGLERFGTDVPTTNLTFGRSNLAPVAARRQGFESIGASLTSKFPYKNDVGVGVQGDVHFVGDRWKALETMTKANTEADLSLGYDPSLGPYASLIASPQFAFSNMPVRPNANVREGQFIAKVGPYAGATWTPGRELKEERGSMPAGVKGSFEYGLGNSGTTAGLSGFFGGDMFGKSAGVASPMSRTQYGLQANLKIPFGVKQKRDLMNLFAFNDERPNEGSYQPKFQDGGFVQMSDYQYAPENWVNKKGELKKGVKWVDNPALEKTHFENTEGEQVYAYNAGDYGLDMTDENPWLERQMRNEGPMQYQRKPGWWLEDLFRNKNRVVFQGGGEYVDMELTDEEIQNLRAQGYQVDEL